MKNVLSFTLAVLLGLPGTTFTATAQVPTLKELRAGKKVTQRPKLAPDLEEMLAEDEGEQQAIGVTLAQARQNRREQKKTGSPPRYRVKGVTLPAANVPAEERQSFIIQTEGTAPDIVWQEKLALLGGRISQKFAGTGLVVVEAPRTAIRQIAAESSIAYVSPDRPVMAQGHVETTTGAAQIRSLIAGKTLNGTGIGVAVIDSGTDDWHNRTYFNAPGVVYQQDFTGASNYHDSFGHGTHVTSLIAGDDSRWVANYEGIAQGAKVISLRVLNGLGLGAASTVIAALDWCVANKATYNIRVINLSLGTRAKDSYKTDPLCLAARRAVNAGIVVVAAAGNEGKDLLGSKVYGGIHSPAIDPAVITVGAASTYSTDARGDDTVATTVRA
ncbi:MAG: S8 family serine peptidase [Blastocatellia bacterium]